VTAESDSYQPKNSEKYERMLRFMRSATGPENLNQILLLYLFDLSYDRGDISAALHFVEREKGFR
jgi:hypothetical protein